MSSVPPATSRSLRFLVTPRWVSLLLIVLVWGYACLLLGRWQWHRLESTEAANTIVRTNEHARPRPVDEVLRKGVDPSSQLAYARVVATGTYDRSKTIIVRYQTHGGNPGVDVVVPLVTSSGTALLVDRGWFATTNQGDADASLVPAPPSGTVTVIGWVRSDASGGSAQVVDDSTRSISSATIGPAIGIPVYGGFVQLLHESPAPQTALTRAGFPDLTNGPHFFYALQWWFFGIMGIFGYLYLAWEEKTGRADLRRASQEPKVKQKKVTIGVGGSERARDAAIDREHDAADERRRRAEQESGDPAEL